MVIVIMIMLLIMLMLMLMLMIACMVMIMIMIMIMIVVMITIMLAGLLWVTARTQPAQGGCRLLAFPEGSVTDYLSGCYRRIGKHSGENRSIALHVVTVDQTHQLALAHLVCLRNGSLALRGPLLPPSLLNNAPRQGG